MPAWLIWALIAGTPMAQSMLKNFDFFNPEGKMSRELAKLQVGESKKRREAETKLRKEENAMQQMNFEATRKMAMENRKTQTDMGMLQGLLQGDESGMTAPGAITNLLGLRN